MAALFKKLFWIALFLTLFIRGIIFLDPDFGWRLKSGEIILQNGIPKTDPFTYSMPSFPWINHAWGTDVIIATLYPIVGFVGLSLLFSLITLAAIYTSYTLVFKIKLNVGNTKNRLNFWFISAPLLLLTAASFFRFTGIRAQVWSWLFMSVIFKLVFDGDFWKKYRFYLPILFLFWVNLHGGFAAGLATLIFLEAVRSFRQKKIDFVSCLLILLSILTTFINPYGPEIYKEVWYTLVDSENHKNILEWNSYLKSFNLPSLFLIVIASMMVFRTKEKFKLEELGIYVLFFYQALTAVRQVPLWVMVAFYMSFKAITNFYYGLNIKFAKKRFRKVYEIFNILVILIFLIEVFLAFNGAVNYSEKVFYPKDAINFIKERKTEGQIYSKYDYGGYLIWKLPERKVFIDGRMPFWSSNENPNNESANAMKEYMSLFRGETSYRQLFQKYDVEIVLWTNLGPNGGSAEIENKYLDRFQFLYKLLGIKKQNFNLIKDLETDGWVKIYEDKIAIVYQKPQQFQ